MSFQPFMFIGDIQAFEKEGTDRILTRLWDGGIRELVLGDLSEPLTPEFFGRTVPAEIAKMIHRCGGPESLRPWLGLHHGGVRISTTELEQLMDAVTNNGLQSIIYWHYSDMTEEEWSILQRHITL